MSSPFTSKKLFDPENTIVSTGKDQGFSSPIIEVMAKDIANNIINHEGKNYKRVFMDSFLEYFRNSGKAERNPVVLYNYNGDFYHDVIEREYKCNWDHFFFDIGLAKENSGFSLTVEERIQKRVNSFIQYLIDEKINRFSPKTISKFNHRIYRSLTKYKTEKGEVDRPYIIDKFFKSYKDNWFDLNNIEFFIDREFVVTESIIQKRVNSFIQYLIDEKINRFSPITIFNSHRPLYGSLIKYKTEKGEVDRPYIIDKFFKSYKDNWFDLNNIEFFIDDGRFITEDVIQERVNLFIKYMKESNIVFFSPNLIIKFSYPLYCNLIKYRTTDEKIDWLYILHRFFNSNEYYFNFRHVNNDTASGYVRTKSFSDYVYTNITDEALSPEELLIIQENGGVEEEKFQINDEQYGLYKQALLKLMDSDKILIERFLSGEDIGEDYMRIVQKLQYELKDL